MYILILSSRHIEDPFRTVVVEHWHERFAAMNLPGKTQKEVQSESEAKERYLLRHAYDTLYVIFIVGIPARQSH